MNPILTVASAVSLLALAYAGVVAANDVPCTKLLSEKGGVYVVDRGAGRVVVYRESNNVSGLQTGGADVLGLRYDTCGASADHDQLLACADSAHCAVP